MNKKPSRRALLKHRLILQAAFCVEDLLLTTEKGAERKPWIEIVSSHMEALLEPSPRRKRRQ